MRVYIIIFLSWANLNWIIFWLRIYMTDEWYCFYCRCGEKETIYATLKCNHIYIMIEFIYGIPISVLGLANAIWRDWLEKLRCVSATNIQDGIRCILCLNWWFSKCFCGVSDQIVSWFCQQLHNFFHFSNSIITSIQSVLCHMYAAHNSALNHILREIFKSAVITVRHRMQI